MTRTRFALITATAVVALVLLVAGWLIASPAQAQDNVVSQDAWLEMPNRVFMPLAANAAPPQEATVNAAGGWMGQKEFFALFKELVKTLQPGNIEVDITRSDTIENDSVTVSLSQPGEFALGVNGDGCHNDGRFQGLYVFVDGVKEDISKPNAECAWFGTFNGTELKVSSEKGSYWDAESIHELRIVGVVPTTTPTATPTSTPSPTWTETATPTSTSTPWTPSPTPTSTETATPTATQTPTPTWTPTSTPTASNTPTPTATETSTPTVTSTPSPTWTPEVRPSPTPTPVEEPCVWLSAQNTQLPLGKGLTWKTLETSEYGTIPAIHQDPEIGGFTMGLGKMSGSVRHVVVGDADTSSYDKCYSDASVILGGSKLPYTLTYRAFIDDGSGVWHYKANETAWAATWFTLNQVTRSSCKKDSGLIALCIVPGDLRQEIMFLPSVQR